jgi:putative spermidine/putrescine transport system permease protein
VITRLITGLVVIFMLAPVVTVVWMSFTPSAQFVLPLTEFSLRWYREAFAYSGFTKAFFLSLRLGLMAAAIAVTLSFFAAYALVRSERLRGKGALEALFFSPLVMPSVALGIAMLQYVNAIGLYNEMAGMVLAHAIIVTPFAVRLFLSSLKAVPIEVEWAAMNLGASRTRMLLTIVLPTCRRGAIAAFLLCFLMSFSEVTVTIFMAGPAQQTLPVRIYNYLTDQVDPTVAAVSSMIVFLSISLMFVIDRLGGLKGGAK